MSRPLAVLPLAILPLLLLPQQASAGKWIIHVAEALGYDPSLLTGVGASEILAWVLGLLAL